MLIFQEPAPTRYDLRFNLAGIPVRVHPLFWLVAVLFGFSGELFSTLSWVVAVFVAILVHEIGHALAMRSFGRPSRIVLYLGGGLTIPESVSWGYRPADVSLSINQEILVSLAGPGAGFLFAGLILGAVIAAGGAVATGFIGGVIPFPVATTGYAIPDLLIWHLLWVNIFWGLINLAPVIPLDGGNVARYLWLKADPWNGVNRSLWLSVVAGSIVALAGLILLRSIYIAILFGLLAVQSYQTVSGRRYF